MAENIVILSPHFPPHYHRFWLQLKLAGGRALGIGDAPEGEIAPEVRTALTEYRAVGDLHDYDALVRACGWYTHRFGKIERFESLNEYWLETEARIREDFNIPGPRPAEIERVRRKSRMKEVFRAAGLPTAPGRRAGSLEEARAFAAEVGYPLVAKPDAGVGARNTHGIESEAGLAALFTAQPDEEWFLEAFVVGELHSFDGLADREGRPLFTTAHVFSQGILETVREGRDLFYYSLREIPPGLEEAGLRSVSAFAVRERFFHIEFFHTADGAWVPLEINLRPPGGWTTDMFNYSADADIYRAWAELLVRGETALPPRRLYHCGYCSRRRNRRYAHTHNDVISRYGHHILQVEAVPPVLSGPLGDTGYLFRSPSLEQLHDIARFIQQPAG
ncbi:MAG: carboxylate--amine ligase [Desulfobacterales bacterium]